MKLTSAAIAALVLCALAVTTSTPANACSSKKPIFHELAKIICPPSAPAPALPRVDAPSPRVEVPSVPQDVRDLRDQVAALKNTTVTVPIAANVTATAGRDGVVINADLPLGK